jgi:hypothetical protein
MSGFTTAGTTRLGTRNPRGVATRPSGALLASSALGLLLVFALIQVGADSAPASAAQTAATSTTTAGTRSAPDKAQTQTNRVTFGIEPASASGGDGRPFLSYGATPGATLSDDVAALNYSTSPLTLQIYGTDAVETTGGGYGLLPPNTKPTGVGAWVSLPASDSTVTVPPQTATGPGEVVIPVELRVPANAQPGDHSGAIVASLSTLGKNAKSQNIQLVQRVGTRLFVKVAGTANPQLTLTVTHSGYDGVLNPVGKGRVVVSYVVKNTGNVNLGFEQTASFDPLIGSTRTLQLQKVNILFPGAQVAETATFSGVYPEVLESRTVTIKPFVPEKGGATGAAVTSTAIVLAIPWTLLALVLLLVALTIAYFYVRSRRQTKDDGSLGLADPDESAEPDSTALHGAEERVVSTAGGTDLEEIEVMR